MEHENVVPQAWVSLIDEAEARAVVPPGHPYDFGAIGGMTRLLLTHPRIGPAFANLAAQVMFEPGHLDRAEREMVAAVAAAAQDCFYCTQSHAEFLRVEHNDPELVDAVKERRWRELDALSPRQRALCELAEKLSGNPTRMVERDWQPLRDLGFDDIACLEVAHVVGLFNHLTRLANGFGLQLDEHYQRAAETGDPLQRPR
jgi:uncharacterized peroxidase-related enzyme